LNEPVLPLAELKKKYKLIIGGHIHTSYQEEGTLIAGSIFNNEVGEIQKYIWKVVDGIIKNSEVGFSTEEKSTFLVEKIPLPGRSIVKLENPTNEQLSALKKDSIVKVIVSDKSIDVEQLKEKLSAFDASLIVEDYPNERTKTHVEGALDFDIKNLLKVYADSKGLDCGKLLAGLELISN